MAKIELKNRIRRLRFDHDEMTQQELANRARVTGSLRPSTCDLRSI